MSRWKNTEREIAEWLGGERVPVTGRQRGSAPDISHSLLAIEVKDRNKFPNWLHDAMEQAVASANISDQAGRLPIVVLHEKGKHHKNDFVMIRLEDFVSLLNQEDSSDEAV